MKFGKILKRAWQITWQYRALWFFGILASWVTSKTSVSFASNASYEVQSPAISPGTLPPGIERFFFHLEEQIDLFGYWVEQHWMIILSILVMIIALRLAMFLLGLMGQGGLIYGIARVEADPEAPMGIAEIWQGAAPFYAPLLGLYLLQILLIGGLILVLFGPALALMVIGAFNESVAALLTGAGLFTLGLFIITAAILVWQALYILALRFIVLAKDEVLSAVGHAWTLFRQHLGEIVLSALITFGTRLIVIAPLVLALLPSSWAFMRWMAGARLPLLRILGLNFAIYLPISIVLYGIYETFEYAFWTLVYQNLVQPPAAAADTIEASSVQDGAQALDAAAD